MEEIQPENQPEEVKWNGWGYSDTRFVVNKDGVVELTGARYLFSGKTFPELRKWAEETAGLDIDKETPPQKTILVPKPNLNKAFVNEFQSHDMGTISFDPQQRLYCGHGHTLQEIFALREGKINRLPDAVISPENHEHVERIMACAKRHDVCIIPFGGGTSVTQALLCPEKEKRMIVALDMKSMNRVLWIDHDNMTMKVEAGAVGKQLEEQLNARGYRLGHEPDSYEFSSVGGWVATRASGMKKNVYGNIEDLLVAVRMVTPSGTVEKNCEVPRISSGPDIFQMILGSEGILGVITEVVLKVRPMPSKQLYGSIVFPDFESGVACLREIQRQKCAPASIRLVDNEQFKFGQCLKPGDASSWWDTMADWAKKIYVTKIKGFNVDRMVVATLVLEGRGNAVNAQLAQINAIAAQFGGLNAGPENGVRGYFLTYVIAYIRDFSLQYGYIAESFETSVPWSRALPLCLAVKKTVADAAKANGVVRPPFVSCRVTQLYDAGVAVYFYFGFLVRGLDDPVAVFSRVEELARDTILACGGSISHHHGVGKLRKHWMKETVSPVGLRMLNGLKHSVDPTNLMVAGNLIDYVESTTSKL
mmetsp:Transcript_15515/g.26720  ORF Transcript_15515/g.26720 Transcript_15515/m.26720 type:complete len:590 (+) Transcript_15515:111-1880(+)